MKKKLLVLLLIIAVAAFVFVGCTPGGEGEGEGEGEVEDVVVEFEGQYVKDGRIYVQGGVANKITVTFPAPVKGIVQVDLTDCIGNYAKGGIALFPNVDKTVWTGFIPFSCHTIIPPGPCAGDTSCVDIGHDCCATTVTITSGACDTDTCLVFPVIVDCDPPEVKLCVDAKCCACEGIELHFKSTQTPGTCAPDEDDCYDYCSGVAGWSLNIFCGYPFDECCEVPCAEPIFTASGTDCPIDVKTSCLTCKTCGELRAGCELCQCDGEDCEDYTTEYYVVFSIWDNVGNEIEQGAWLCAYEYEEDGKCKVDLEYPDDVDDCIEDLLLLVPCPK